MESYALDVINKIKQTEVYTRIISLNYPDIIINISDREVNKRGIEGVSFHNDITRLYVNMNFYVGKSDPVVHSSNIEIFVIDSKYNNIHINFSYAPSKINYIIKNKVIDFYKFSDFLRLEKCFEDCEINIITELEIEDFKAYMDTFKHSCNKINITIHDYIKIDVLLNTYLNFLNGVYILPNSINISYHLSVYSEHLSDDYDYSYIYNIFMTFLESVINDSFIIILEIRILNGIDNLIDELEEELQNIISKHNKKVYLKVYL